MVTGVPGSDTRIHSVSQMSGNPGFTALVRHALIETFSSQFEQKSIDHLIGRS